MTRHWNFAYLVRKCATSISLSEGVSSTLTRSIRLLIKA
jgi:hypothetical protein